jgi:hypothetical protein
VRQPGPGGLIFGLIRIRFVYVHRCSDQMRRCRSRTGALFAELLSRVLKIGRSMVRATGSSVTRLNVVFAGVMGFGSLLGCAGCGQLLSELLLDDVEVFA